MVRVVHSTGEYYDLAMWSLPCNKENEENCKYYRLAQEDLMNILFVYRGVRVRDIKSTFADRTDAELDLDRLGLTSWVTFLISMGLYIEFRLDTIKEEVLAFASDEGRMTFGGHEMSHMERMIIATPKTEVEAPRLQNLVVIDAKKAYMDGFLDVADGVPMADPRIPNQDLGVAAAAAKKAAEALAKKRRRQGQGKKQSFEQQIAKAPGVPTVTIETTAPTVQTQTGTVENAMNAMMLGPEVYVSSIMSPNCLYGEMYGAPL